MTVEIAPNVFARSWDDVITGYHHPSEQFIIDINLGGALHRLAVCFLTASFLSVIGVMAIAKSHSLQLK